MTQLYTVFDTETTGFTHNHVVEFAFVVMDGNFQIQHSESVLVKPADPIEAGAMEVHGITNEMVADKPSIQEYFEHNPAWESYFGELTLIGHNIKGYDIPKVMNKFRNLDHCQTLDTLALARALYTQGEVGNHKLQTLVSKFGLPQRDAHRALSDVESCIDFMQHVQATKGMSIYDMIDLANNNVKRKKAQLLAALR